MDRDSLKRKSPLVLKEKVVTERPSRFGRPRYRVQTKIVDDGRTEQQHADEADIRTLMARAKATGQLPYSQRPQISEYMDLTDAPTYQEALNVIAEARNVFSELPASIRDRYNNDPARFLEGIKTEEGQKLLIKAGLATPIESKPSSSDGVGTQGQAESASAATPTGGA